MVFFLGMCRTMAARCGTVTSSCLPSVPPPASLPEPGVAGPRPGATVPDMPRYATGTDGRVRNNGAIIEITGTVGLGRLMTLIRLTPWAPSRLGIYGSTGRGSNAVNLT